MKPKPITVVGSYNTGLTISVSRLPRSGETLSGTGFSEGPGGKGSNQAIAARRLGGRVSFVGCVGRDAGGDRALELLKKEGVDVRFVRRSDSHTGVGFVVVGARGENAIVIDPGANLDLEPADVARAEPVIARSGVMLLQLETSLRAVSAAARLGKRHLATVILNPAPASRATTLKLGAVDVITPNQGELLELTGSTDPKKGANVLLGMGPSAVIVTLGDKGAAVFTHSESYRVAAPKVSVVDTAGAGDAFNGALAVAMSEGTPLREAVEFANYAGALAVTRREVVPGLPTRGQLEAFRKGRREGSAYTGSPRNNP